MPQPIDHQEVVLTSGRETRKAEVKLDATHRFHSAGVKEERSQQPAAAPTQETSEHLLVLRDPEAATPTTIAQIWWQTQLASPLPFSEIEYVQDPAESGRITKPGPTHPATPAPVAFEDQQCSVSVQFVGTASAGYTWSVTSTNGPTGMERIDTWVLTKSMGAKEVFTATMRVALLATPLG